MSIERLGSKSLIPFSIAWLAYVIVLFGIAVFLFPKVNVLQRSDFRCFYTAGLIARTSPAHLYDIGEQRRIQAGLSGAANAWLPFIQPPYEGLILAPFSLFSYRTAYLLMMAFNLLLLWPCVLLARDAFSNYIDPWQPRPGLVFFLFFPLFIALVHQQSSIRLLLVLCATWHELRRGRKFTAGLILSVALFKLNLVLPLAFLLFVWQGFEFLAGFVAGSGVLVGISFRLVGASGMKAFIAAITKAGPDENFPSNTPSAMPNINGLIHLLASRFTSREKFVCTLVISLIVMALACLWIRRESDAPTAFAQATIVAMLLSFHLYPHDLVVLLLPICQLAGQARPWFSATVAACFLFYPALMICGLPRALMALPLIALLVEGALVSPTVSINYSLPIRS